MDGNLATTYTLIYAFLTKHSHTKVAQALKKAAKDIVILKDDIEVDGPQLDEIIKDWEALEARKIRAPPSPTDSDLSDEDSPSDSTSSSESSISESPKKSKVLNSGRKRKRSVSSPSSSSSSSSSSSDSDSTSEEDSCSSSSDSSDSDDSSVTSLASSENRKIKDQLKKIGADIRDSSSTLTSSSSPSSRDSESDSKTDIKPPLQKQKPKKAAIKVDKKDSPSPPPKREQKPKIIKVEKKDSPSPPKKQKPKKMSIKVEKKESPPPPSDSESKSSLAKQQATKKRRTSESGAAIVTATSAIKAEESPGPKSAGFIKPGSGNPRNTTNERFRRVDPDKVPVHSIVDNSYETKAAPKNDYGQRAHQDLIVTRGAGFRKEKNKKKKGSYKGGEITMTSHSFKFT